MSADLESSSVQLTDLLADACDGDDGALAQLLNADRNYLLLVAEAELDSGLRVKTSQSDLVQDTIFEAQQSFAEFRGTSGDGWRKWLLVILKNNIKDARRRYVDAEKRSIRKEVGNAQNMEAVDGDESPSQHAVKAENVQQLASCVKKLPQRYQDVLQLRFWQQLSYDQIAEMTNSTSEAVRKMLYRAVEALNREFRRQGK